MSAVSAEFNMSVGPALAAIDELVKNMAAALSSIGKAAAPIGEHGFDGIEKASEGISKNMDKVAAASAEAMAETEGAARKAGEALTQTGAKAVAGAAGMHGYAAASHAAGGAQQGFVAKATEFIVKAGHIGAAIVHIQHSVHLLQGLYARFRGNAPQMHQTAAATHQAATATNAAIAPTRNWTSALLKIGAVAGIAAAGVWGLSKAYKAVAGTKPPALPRMPSGGGMGGGFSQGLSQSGSQLGNYTTMFQGLFSKMGPMIAAGLAAAGLAGLVGKSLQKGASDQTMQVKMDVLMGDSDKSAALLKDLKQVAADTAHVLKFEDLQSGATGLLQAGASAKDIAQTFRAVGDVAIGAGAGINTMAQQFEAARKKGQLFTADLSTFSEEGVPIVEALAAALGKSTAQIEDMASKGGISFTDLQSAFSQLTGEGGRFHGVMQRQAKTTSGLMETIKDETAAVFSELGKPLNDILGQKLAGDVDFAKKLHEAAKKLGIAFGEAAKFIIAAWQEIAAGDSIQMLRDGLSLAFKEAVNVLYAAMQGGLQSYGVVLGSVMKAGVALFSFMNEASFWEGMGNAFGGIADKFRSSMLHVMATILEGVRKVPGMGGVIGDLPETLRAVARDYSESGAGKLSDAKSQLDPYFAEFQKLLKEALDTGAKAFSDGYKNAGKVFEDGPEKEKVAALLAAIQKRMADNIAAAKVTGGDVLTKKPAGEGAGVAKISTGLGDFQKAVNFLSGRSVNELILTEAQKQTEEQRKTNGLLKEVKDKLPGKTPPSTAGRVDMTPRFNGAF